MAGFSILEQQIDVLNALHVGSAKALDAFSDTSKAIANRARRIAADVRPWEMAQENIASTIEEMSKAARCYHPPPSLRLVLARKEKNPEALCKCIDYLVFADNYLASHPPNSYGCQVALSVSGQLASIVEVAEAAVKEAFIHSMQRTELVVHVKNEEGELTPVLIQNPAALEGIDRVVQRLGENFNRTDVISVDVKQLLEDRMLRLVNSVFDRSYEEEEMQCYHTIDPTFHSIAPVRKHYQKGDHRILGISAKAKRLIGEVANILRRVVLTPLDDSFDVVDIPGDLATLVFDLVKEKCFAALEIDRTSFLNPTRMFVLSRGEGIGLWGETRHFRDVIFIGLDLLEELWKWKNFADNLPVECPSFVDHVDAEVERFLFEVRDLLDSYLTCKGALDVELLKEYARNMHRMEWLPSLDCSAHVSVTNQVYLHKMMLSNYFGTVKLVLHGPVLNAAAEVESLQEVEDYITRCVLGTLRDLEAIAEAAMQLQMEAANRKSLYRSITSMPLSTMQQQQQQQQQRSSLTERVHITFPAAFMLNNINFFTESYRKEACFHQRRLAVEHSGVPSNERTRTEATSIPFISNIISILDDEKKRFVDDFAASWSECFPSVTSEPHLASIKEVNGALQKEQRMAVKHWYRDVAAALTARIAICRTFTILDISQRSTLIEASAMVVREQFRAFEARLRGREWSKRPLKWMMRSVEQWIELLSKSL